MLTRMQRVKRAGKVGESSHDVIHTRTLPMLTSESRCHGNHSQPQLIYMFIKITIYISTRNTHLLSMRSNIKEQNKREPMRHM